jgi:hypothetical protein
MLSGMSHEVLGIPMDSDEDAINSAFKKLSLVWHPDKHPASAKDGATEVFCRLQAAKKELIGECHDYHLVPSESPLAPALAEASHSGHV